MYEGMFLQLSPPFTTDGIFRKECSGYMFIYFHIWYHHHYIYIYIHILLIIIIMMHILYIDMITRLYIIIHYILYGLWHMFIYYRYIIYCVPLFRSIFPVPLISEVCFTQLHICCGLELAIDPWAEVGWNPRVLGLDEAVNKYPLVH